MIKEKIHTGDLSLNENIIEEYVKLKHELG